MTNELYQACSAALDVYTCYPQGVPEMFIAIIALAIVIAMPLIACALIALIVLLVRCAISTAKLAVRIFVWSLRAYGHFISLSFKLVALACK